jgi:hypothetical protein
MVDLEEERVHPVKIVVMVVLVEEEDIREVQVLLAIQLAVPQEVVGLIIAELTKPIQQVQIQDMDMLQ